MSMINLFYVSFAFPPVNAAASFRALKITNNLHKHSIIPTVLTKNIEIEQKIHRTTDLTLLRDVVPGTKVLRARYFSPSIFEIPFIIIRRIFSAVSRFLRKGGPGRVGGKVISEDPFIPDHYIEWLPIALLKALKNIKPKNVDVIYVTGPPFSVFILGYFLKARWKRPLVVEYRDPWTDDPYKNTPALKERLNRNLELMVLKNADAVICISEPLKKHLITKYGLEEIENRFFSVPSAFDPSDFHAVKETSLDPKDFKLSLTTTMYGERNPDLLFKTISLLKKKGILNGINFQIDIYGNNPKEPYEDLLKRLDINDLVKFNGFIPHDECLYKLKNSTLNLDLSERDVDYPSFPFHIWEYIGSGRKFLYLGKDNSYKADYIRENDLGYVLPLDKPRTFYQEFEKIIMRFREGKLDLKIDPERIRRQTWDYRVNKLASIISRLASRR
ncbi:MAG: glycosyltransferase [Promethearchaeota archaeon]